MLFEHLLLIIHLNDINAVEKVIVEKQAISDHSLAFVTRIGEKRRTKFSETQYQCWKNYSKQTLKTELGRTYFEKISTGSPPQIC